MQYVMKAYETLYQGVRFRSRLEARWAAMFDLMGWRWDYEPLDFNNWIPDFVLFGKTTVYVEVKPVLAFPQDVAQRIDNSGCPDEVLIVGMTCPMYPLHDPYYNHVPCVGWLREVQGDGALWWDFAPLGRWNRSIGFCHLYGSYQDRMSGGYDGNLEYDRLAPHEIPMLWREAGNRTQWRRRASTYENRCFKR